jgi:hypothetical protein
MPLKHEVWFAIPSANPDKCRATLPAWRDMGYKIAILQNWERATIPADIVEWTDEYPGWAGSINHLVKRVVPKAATVIVSGGDDMLPDPNLTASEIAEQFYERFPDGFGVMQPHGDDWADTVSYCGSPWIGRAFADSMYRGHGPMWPGYRHNWADLELYWVARGMNALWTRDDLTQRHEHFWRTGEERSAYWERNVGPNDKADVQLYISRMWQRFPGHEPVGVSRVFNPSDLAVDTVRLAEKHFANNYAPTLEQDDWKRRMRHALARLASQGVQKVAIYGAGSHTIAIADELRSPPVEISCVIDDNPKNQGTRLWGFPIVSRDQAASMGVGAVVLSANSIEDKLWEATASLRAKGVEVVRLHERESETRRPAASTPRRKASA